MDTRWFDSLGRWQADIKQLVGQLGCTVRRISRIHLTISQKCQVKYDSENHLVYSEFIIDFFPLMATFHHDRSRETTPQTHCTISPFFLPPSVGNCLEYSIKYALTHRRIKRIRRDQLMSMLYITCSISLKSYCNEVIIL